MANLKLKENLDVRSTGVSTSGQNALPKTGDIIAFAGATAPTGWVICDGANGTPDLRGYFVVGAVSSANIGVTYGSSSHTHTTSVNTMSINTDITNNAGHGVNSFQSGTNNYDGDPAHTHGSILSGTSGSGPNNLLANSTNASGPITFVPRPHSHGISVAVFSGNANVNFNHSHNNANATVNLSTGVGHGAGHTVSGSPQGNLNSHSSIGAIVPYIIMNYIMKV